MCRRPYLIDLGGVNGTMLNKERIEPLHYIEMREEDIVNFGNSSRDYVLMKADLTRREEW